MAQPTAVGAVDTPRTGAKTDNNLLIAAKAAALRLKPHRTLTASARAELCLALLGDGPTPAALANFASLLTRLPIVERHYWIGTLYTLLLPPKTRRKQAAFFTPPYLAEAVLDLAIAAGFELARHTVLDPAAGGAAFLSTIAGRRLDIGLPPDAAATGLHGIEIDPGLAAISRALLADRIRRPIPKKLIRVFDALSTRASEKYDLVIANPPYGRTSPSALARGQWEKVAYSGHINKYAVFAQLCLKAAKSGGVVALVIPSSFRAGPLYDRLRSHLCAQGEIQVVGTVASREGVFADVAQDISVLVVRRGKPHQHTALVSFPTLPPPPQRAEPRRARLPADPKLPWPTPIASDRNLGGACLADYGVEARAGYFVWNREGERLTRRRAKNAYPLIWARNIIPGQFCTPLGKKNEKTDFVTFDHESSAIIRTPAAVLQRTTNDKQPRRLVAALVDPAVIKTWGGFVTENHTIVLTAKSLARLRLVVELLNTKAADDRYRKVSGTAAVSVTLLRELDLPLPVRFESALEITKHAETAAKLAYSNASLRAASK
jgi:adenine-specific DNA-methyltransferase